MLRNRLCLVVGLALLLSIGGLSGCGRRGPGGVEAAREDEPLLTPAEQDFAMKASQAHLAEIEVGRLAEERSQNADVKSYAKMIVDDHGKALPELTELTKKYNGPQPQPLDPEVMKEIERLAALSGAEFDREFVNMMVGDHEKAIELFRNQSQIALNTDVKDYVNSLLPKLEKHLTKAQELQSKLFRGNKTY
jgi:putative membrane protein